MALVSLADLRTRAKYRSDNENSSFISDAEWTVYINQSLAAMIDYVEQFNEDFTTTNTTWTSTGSEDGYTLPSDFMRLRGVEYRSSSGGNWKTILRYNFGERNRRQNGYHQEYNRYEYRLTGNKLMFMPTPESGTQFRMWYLPLKTLGDETDTFDFQNGWEDFVIVDAAIRAVTKEENIELYQLLVPERDRILQRLELSAQHRDTGDCETVIDVNALDDEWFW